MSLISINAPTVQANASDLQNMVKFISTHERLLKEFGAIKIELHAECQQAFKKRRTDLQPCAGVQQVVRVSKDELIYSVHTVSCTNGSAYDQPLTTNENTFWSSLSHSSKGQQRSNISVFPDKSFYSKRAPRTYFDLHRIPSQSLLKIGGSKVTRQFIPSLTRALGPGAIFPLASARQRLFSLDYHHEGGVREWYIIPVHEREALQQVLVRQNASICLEHGHLLIDPSVLDKYNIRYHRLVQHPNEFVVLAAGALAQSFTESASWSESIAFALPSWLQDGHAAARASPCTCHFDVVSVPEIIDIGLFRHELVQRYSDTHLSLTIDDASTSSTGQPLNEFAFHPVMRISDDNSVNIVEPIITCDSTTGSLKGNFQGFCGKGVFRDRKMLSFLSVPLILRQKYIFSIN